MMKKILAAFLLLNSMQVFATTEELFARCIQKTDSKERLACYDEISGFSDSADPAVNLVASSSSKPSSKQSPSDEDEENESTFARDNRWTLSKLTSDDPNFFGVSYDPGRTERGVKTHFEFDISIKYPVWEFSDDARWYLIYNGSYDFQALTTADIYDSSPVISTTQNPGTAIEWDLGDGKSKFRAGFFHHSNGQTLTESRDDVLPETLAKNALALEEFNRIENEWGEAPALERVSRSSWYGQLRYQWMSDPEGKIREDWRQFQLEVRPFYVWNDDRIFWSDEWRHQPQLENFDGLRAVGEAMISLPNLPFIPDRALARLELQTGLWSPFENVGGEFTLGINFKNNLLFSWYYYSGFAKDIASYHTRTQHMGFGFELR